MTAGKKQNNSLNSVVIQMGNFQKKFLGDSCEFMAANVTTKEELLAKLEAEQLIGWHGVSRPASERERNMGLLIRLVHQVIVEAGMEDEDWDG